MTDKRLVSSEVSPPAVSINMADSKYLGEVRAFPRTPVKITNDSGGPAIFELILNDVVVDSGEVEPMTSIQYDVKLPSSNFNSLESGVNHAAVLKVTGPKGGVDYTRFIFVKTDKSADIDSVTDLGEVSSLVYKYKFTGDYDTNIIFRINGREVGNNSNAAPGKEYTFKLPDSEFEKLISKHHYLEVLVSTPEEDVSKYVRFKKTMKADNAISYFNDNVQKYPAVKHITDGKRIVSGEDISSLIKRMGDLSQITSSGETLVDAINKLHESADAKVVATVSNLKAEIALLDSGSRVVNLTWSDPADSTIDIVGGGEVLFAKWSHTVIVRTIDKPASKVSDGMIVVKNFARDNHKVKPFSDPDATPGEINYYTAFTISDSGGYSKGVSVEISTKGTPVGDVTDESIKAGDSMAEIKWSDPKDNDWLYTDLVRKLGREPRNINDGDRVKRNRVRDQYKTHPVADTDLMNDEKYYYKLFTVSKSGGVSRGKTLTATPEESWLHGFAIDESNTNPKTAVRYVGEQTVVNTPAYREDYGDWESFVKTIATPVVFKNGKVQYELQHDNFTKKKDGSPSDLTGKDGDVMIRFDHIWSQTDRKGGKTRNVWVSNGPFAIAKSYTKETEYGYNQLTWGILMALQDLFLLIYKDRDSQRALGMGRVDEHSPSKTGLADQKPFCYGAPYSSSDPVKFLGIEHMWGNLAQFVDGVAPSKDFKARIGFKDFNDTGVGYNEYDIGVSSDVYGAIKSTAGGVCGYIPTEKQYSYTSAYTDHGAFFNGDAVARFGGFHINKTHGKNAQGMFSLSVSASRSIQSDSGTARLTYVDSEHFYVGAYTGIVIDGRLRSVSGVDSTTKMTISEFRKAAQANNNMPK